MMSALDRLFDRVQWVALDQDALAHHDDVPYATHEGWLEIGDIRLHVYQLNTGDRVIEEESMQRFFRWLGGSHE
jgi:hypothetical protein